jgi:2-pyrone-4,6-dicarboxylate lactonase
MMNMPNEPPRIAGPVAQPKRPRIAPPPGAWDSHFHIFGPADKFPYQPGRGYTPPDAPVERLIALLNHLGFASGLVVQGNAHVYDNSVVLDALARFPKRLRGVAITDTRIEPKVLRDWHIIGAASGSTCSRCFAAPWPISAGSRSSFAITACWRRQQRRSTPFPATCR